MSESKVHTSKTPRKETSVENYLSMTFQRRERINYKLLDRIRLFVHDYSWDTGLGAFNHDRLSCAKCLNYAVLIIKYCTMLGAETKDHETLPSPTRMISISSLRGGSHARNAYGNAQRDGQREMVAGLWGCEICEITGVSVVVPRAYASDGPEALHQK